MTLGRILDHAAEQLKAGRFAEPRRLARRLVAAALRLSPGEVFAHPERALGAADQARIGEMLRRFLQHEPLSRIVGCREFWGLELLLSADTLDPRPETETVVEAVLARLPDRGRAYQLLDLGTGSGCLLLALLSELPHAGGIGTDIAPGAARAARRNAERLGLATRACFAAVDWGQALAGGFDVVVANPPYISTAAIDSLPREVREHDPRRALDGGADGLAAYRAIAADLPRLLSPGGLFAAEIGAGQQNAVGEILKAAGLRVEGALPDLAAIARCLIARR